MAGRAPWRWWLAGLGLWAGTCAAAASAAPFLWAVQGQGARDYLLGSIHMLPPQAHPLPPALEQAYAQAETVVFETDLDAVGRPDAQQALMTAAREAPDGLRGQIDAVLYAQLQRRLERLGLPQNHCDVYQAWFCALSLEMAGYQRAGFSPQLGIDQHYFEAARRDGKRVDWLETPSEQLGLFAQMPPVLGAAFLASALDDGASQSPQRMMDAWRAHDLTFLEDEVEAMRRDHPRAYARLLADRNRAWQGLLRRHLSDARPTLIIVGAAHLVGADGLIGQLRRNGYRVEPVGRSP